MSTGTSASGTLRIHVRKGVPGQAETVTYEIPQQAGQNVLRTLFYIYRNLDPDLAFRHYYCNRGVCLSCLVTVDGKVAKACCTPVRDGMLIEPAGKYETIRDLVVAFDRPKAADAPVVPADPTA